MISYIDDLTGTANSTSIPHCDAVEPESSIALSDEVLGLDTDDVVFQYGLAAFVPETGKFSADDYYFVKGAPGIPYETWPRWFLKSKNQIPGDCNSGVLGNSIQHALSLGLIKIEEGEGGSARAIPTEVARATYMSWSQSPEVKAGSTDLELVGDHSNEDLEANSLFGFWN